MNRSTFSFALQTTLKVLTEFSIYSNLWVSGGVTALACFCMKILGTSPDTKIILLCFFSPLLVMNFDRFIDSRFEERPDISEQKFYLSSFTNLLLIVAIAGTVLSLLLMPRDVQFIGAACISIGVVYGIPLIHVANPFSRKEYGLQYFLPTTEQLPQEKSISLDQEESKDNKSQSYRLKDIKGIKAWLAAAVVTLAVVGVPLAYSDHICLDWKVAQLTAFIYIFLVSNAHIFDVRDLDSDREKGLKTLPVLVGVFQTKVIIIILNILMLSIVLGNHYLGRDLFVTESILITFYNLAYVCYFDAGKTRLLYALIVDGGLFLPLLFLTVHHKLGLPLS